MEMSSLQIKEKLSSAKIGDNLQLFFKKDALDGDSKRVMEKILSMQGSSIEFGEMSLTLLTTLVGTGKWVGQRWFLVKVLENFNANELFRCSDVLEGVDFFVLD